MFWSSLWELLNLFVGRDWPEEEEEEEELVCLFSLAPPREGGRTASVIVLGVVLEGRSTLSFQVTEWSNFGILPISSSMSFRDTVLLLLILGFCPWTEPPSHYLWILSLSWCYCSWLFRLRSSYLDNGSDSTNWGGMWTKTKVSRLLLFLLRDSLRYSGSGFSFLKFVVKLTHCQIGTKIGMFWF